MPRKTSMKTLSAHSQRGERQPVQERDREPQHQAERAARAPAADRDAEAADQRRQVAPQDVGVHRAPSAASRRSASAPKPASAEVDREIEEAAADIGFERAVGHRGDVHADPGQFGDADDRDERRGLEKQDEFVDERRNRDAQRLRHEHAPPDVEAGEPERDRRLALPARHGVERAAQDLRLIGGRRQREPADRRDDRRHVEPEFGEEVIDEKQLHQQRHAAKHADIGAAEAPEPGAARHARDADGGADHEADGDAGERNRDRRRRRLRQVAERVEDDLRLHGVGWIASLRSQ